MNKKIRNSKIVIGVVLALALIMVVFFYFGFTSGVKFRTSNLLYGEDSAIAFDDGGEELIRVSAYFLIACQISLWVV